MANADKFGETLRALRTERGLSQQQLAERMAVTRGAVSMYESGRRLPDLRMLARIADALDVESYVLMDALRESEDAPLIIVVEDVPVVMRGCVKLLEQELPGAEIVGFTNAHDALHFAITRPVAVAFLDIELPGEDGLALGRELTALDARTNIIFLTSHTEYLETAAYDHCSGYIMKPLKPERIRHEIANLRFPVRGLSR